MSIAPEQLLDGHRQYEEWEKRDVIYKVATRLVQESWSNPAEVAEGLGVLLLVWNAAHFRHGPLDFDALESCIRTNKAMLDQYSKRNILSCTPKDDSNIVTLFEALLEALKICESVRGNVKRTPVGAVKALHLLAPEFFRLWDKEIAAKYGCDYSECPAKKYLCFFGKIKDIAADLAENEEVKSLMGATKRSLIKLIDECNYVTYTLPALQKKAEDRTLAKLKKQAGR